MVCAVASNVSSKLRIIENVSSQTIASPVVSTDPGNVPRISESGTSSKLATPPTGSDQDTPQQASGSEEPGLPPFKDPVPSDDFTDDVMDTAGSSMDEGEITDCNPGPPTNERVNQVPIRELGHGQHLRKLELTQGNTTSVATDVPGTQSVEDESVVEPSTLNAPHLVPPSSSSGRSTSQDYLEDGTEPPLTETGQEEGEIEVDDSDDYEPPEPASPVEEKASPSHMLSLRKASPTTSAEPLTEGVLQAASATSKSPAEARQTPNAGIEDPMSPHKVRGYSVAWHLPNVL